MYAKTICPYCRKHSVHSITVQGHASIDISIDETVTAEEFLHSILCSIQRYVRDGIEVRELCRILKRYYGVASTYCCDLIQRIKIELDMYCPDHRHLYFVRP